MTKSTNRPLWQVINAAYREALMSGPLPQGGFCYAVILRAIADWLVPEEDAPTSGGDLAKMKHLLSMRFRAQLLDEADRAEAGE